MSNSIQPSAQPMDPTVRRWKRIFFGIYLVLTGCIVVWAFCSIVMALFGDRPLPVKGPRISPAADNPRELRACQEELGHLLTDLHRDTFQLQAMALRFDLDPASEWGNWSKAWRFRWNAVDWRCRLSSLSGQGISPAIDAMAQIHGELDELQISYSGVVNNFIERYVERLYKLKNDLDAVQKMIPQGGRSVAPPHRGENGERGKHSEQRKQ